MSLWDARWRRIGQTVLAGVAVVALCDLAVRMVPGLRALEHVAQDLVHLTAYPRAGLSPDVVVVAITEETLAGLPYRSPVDREFVAALIERISRAQPKGIAVDLLFDRPTEPDKDAVLRQTLAAPRGHPLVAAYVAPGSILTPAQSAFLETYLPPAARGLALLVADPDDGVVRQVLPSAGGVPSLAYALTGRTPPEAGAGAEAAPVPLAIQVPPDLAQRRFAVYPAQIAAALPDAWFQGKYVLIGADLPDADRFASPLTALLGRGPGQWPGVVFHAQMAAQLIEGRQLDPPGLGARIALGLIAAAAGIEAMLVPVAIAGRLALVLAAVAALWLGAGAALRFDDMVLPVLAPSLACLGAAGYLGIDRWLAERRERRFIRDAFSRYVSPAVVRQILAEPGRLQAGAERRAVTCIFTDVEGFTTLAETLPPDLMTRLLNRYLAGMTRLFFAHDATLNKFVGDAVVGFVGGPIPRPDHAAVAVRLAAALDQFCEGYIAEVARDHGIAFGRTRIGLHSGEVLLGNFGGDQFFDYTAIGDTMNTAARLEGANKYFGTRVCLSDATLAAAPGHPSVPIGRIVLKGKTEATTVHALLTDPGPWPWREGYDRAYSALDTDPAAAALAFAELATRCPEVPLIAFHHGRLAGGATGSLIRMQDK